MKLKSTTYYWLAVVFGGVGMGAAMGAEGTAQTTGYISGTLFAVSLVLILAAVLLARLGFSAEDREREPQSGASTARSTAPTPATRSTRRIRSVGHDDGQRVR